MRITRPNESSYRANGPATTTTEVDAQNSVYAISSSYRLPVSTRATSNVIVQKQQLAPQSEQTISIENIYSQVLVSKNRRGVVEEADEDGLEETVNRDDDAVVDDADQPVYMNTSQFNAMSSHGSSRQASNRDRQQQMAPSNDNWNDSCV